MGVCVCSVYVLLVCVCVYISGRVEPCTNLVYSVGENGVCMRKYTIHECIPQAAALTYSRDIVYAASSN